MFWRYKFPLGPITLTDPRKKKCVIVDRKRGLFDNKYLVEGLYFGVKIWVPEKLLDKIRFN